MENIELCRREEDLLSDEERRDMADLLEEAFPSIFGGRIYTKQLPNFRFLAKNLNRTIGQVGVIHRVVRLGDDVPRIFGIMDLAVAKAERGKKLGTRLLEACITAAKNSNAEFMIAFADDARLYESLGFRRVSNVCTWPAVHEDRTIDPKTESMADCLMVLELCEKNWDSNEELDLLGFLF